VTNRPSTTDLVTEFLREVLAGMPGRATVFRWIARHKEFRHEYTLACELRAKDLADEMIEMIEIVDDPCV
jgi:hypothetical protein